MSEVKRVFNYKKIIMLAVFMCINLFLFMYINVPKSANGQSEREINRYNKYIESYHDEIDSVIKNADYLQKFSIFNKGKTFTYSNILRTAHIISPRAAISRLFAAISRITYCSLLIGYVNFPKLYS